MNEPVVYLNGSFVPASEAKVSIFDRGFLAGDGAFDTARTIDRKPYLLGEHVERLSRSLRYADIDCALTTAEIRQICEEVVERNREFIAPHGDVWIRISVTRGIRQRSLSAPKAAATVVVATEPLNFAAFAKAYEVGLVAVTPPFREIPSECCDPRLKTMSRMHYALAEQFVHRLKPGAIPLMLDLQGFVAQGTAANFFAVLDGELVTPPEHSALAGISRAKVFEIARQNQISCTMRKLNLYDLASAEEAFITGTSYCLLPVCEINGRQVGIGTPGPISKQLLARWSAAVGIDLVAQAKRHID